MRTVDLTPDLATTLKKHLTWLRAEALRVGSSNPEWMFPRSDGFLMDKDYLGAVLRRTLKKSGLPHHRVYDLRHTYASLLLADGTPITYVSAQLGHSSPATTMRHYARWMPSKGRRWVDLLDRKAGNRNEVFVEPKSGASEEDG